MVGSTLSREEAMRMTRHPLILGIENCQYIQNIKFHGFKQDAYMATK